MRSGNAFRQCVPAVRSGRALLKYRRVSRTGCLDGSSDGPPRTLVDVSAGAAAQQPPRSTDVRSGRTDARPRPSSTAGADGAAATGTAGTAGAWSTTGASRSTIDPRRLDREAAERVLRRAVHLDGDVVRDDERVSVQALLDAADELGIDRSEVHRAIVEEEVGLLDDRHRRGDALLGPERFVVARVVDGTAADVEERVDQWMRRGRVLRRTRTQPGAAGGNADRGNAAGGNAAGGNAPSGSGARASGAPGPAGSASGRPGTASNAGGDGGWSEYTRRTDPVAGAQRAMRSLQGSERLAHVRRVRAIVRALDEHRCVVGLVVDASQSRQNAAIVGTAVAVSGTGGSLALGLAAMPGIWPAAGAVVVTSAASVAAGAGVMWSRKVWTNSVPDELESVLDAVASGERPPSVLDDVTARLMGPLRR